MFGSLFKFGFWGSLVLLVLPIDTGNQESQVSALDALFAARETVADIRAICERKPDVCETGGEAFELITARAAAGARMALTYVGEDAQGADTATH